MTISFLTPSRCVLLIGDESLFIYAVSGNATKLLDTVPWQADNFEDTVSSLIKKEGGGKPVLIVNDMTDQHFKGGQRLPKVGLMDKKNVLARKMHVAFPTYPIRGALAMKQPKAEETAPGEAAPQSGPLYLFAAVPMSEPVAKTMDAVKKSLVSVAGFCLLPVKSSDMVRTLAAKLAGKTRAPSRWVVFIGQHHNGALRQVIIRNGQLAMTRMTPVMDTDTDHEAWAKEVHQEFKATISYLSRFGFAPEDGTDVIVVCHPQAGAELEKLIDMPCHYTTFTSPEAARELGITIGQQDDSRFADPLHAAWIGRKTKFILPMKAEDLTKIEQPRQLAALAMFLLLLGGGYLGWQLSGELTKLSQTSESLGNEHRMLTQATNDYDQEVAKMAALGFDVKLVQGAISTFKDLEDRRMHELVMIKKISDAVGTELRLDDLTISDGNATTDKNAPPAPRIAPSSAPGAAVQKPVMQASIKLSFPPTIEPEFGVREINNLQRRLETALPGCTVTIDKNVAGLEYSDTFTGEAGHAADKTANQQYAAELTIRGSLP